MAHKEQRAWCLYVQALHPIYFTNSTVLDVGSGDINGNNRYLFSECQYTGLDVFAAPNVDIVSPVHAWDTTQVFDCVISTECLEHDMYWVRSLRKMVSLVRPGGLFLFTCAAPGRRPHGVSWANPGDSYHMKASDEEWKNYYRNMTEEDIRDALDIDGLFFEYEFSENADAMHDLRFYGVKK